MLSASQPLSHLPLHELEEEEFMGFAHMELGDRTHWDELLHHLREITYGFKNKVK